MSKLVILTVAEGNFGDGFPVTLRIGEEGKSPSIEVSGKLPPTPQIPETYSQWQLAYRSLSIGRIKPIAGQVTNVSISESFQILSSNINDWLASSTLQSLREKLLQNVSLNDEVRVIIRSSVRELQRLPWHLWDLFAGYSHLEIAISTPDLEIQPQAKTPTLKDQIRILAILGDSTGINTQKDRELLEQLPDVEITFLVEPGRKEINDHLWEKYWDILFFAGHSQTEGETGVIYLSKTESLTINELKYGLKKAIKGGLQLAIFNSCDGLGLAWQLEDLQIPQVIVMREPVPDLVAQEFLKYFLTNFASRSGSFYQAVRKARERLQGLENNFPCASLLPVICQNSVAVPPLWENLGRRPTNLCPYRGLFAFREEDAPFFFGRFDFTEKLVESVTNQSLVAVVGPSGIGKSSVVFAGLIPQLRREGNWQVVYLRPSNRPFSALATAILSLRESDFNLTERRQRIKELATYLRDKNGALRDEIDGILWDIPNFNLLLVVDQFEELYTVCQDEEERLCFLDRLLELLLPIANFKLVLTLRADFLGQALSYRPFADALLHQDLKLCPMKRQELEDAIALPAEKLGVAIEDGLTKRLLDAVEKQPGNLPLLEFALTQLWSKMSEATLTHAAYDDIGGVEKALANHAEAVFRQYPEEQERMRRIFIQLVHPGEGTWDTRRVASRAEVGEENWDLVTRLASERLVVSSGKEATGSETVEIVHEALIGGWGRLQEWIHANRRFRTWQERLRVSLRQWQENQRVDGALLQRVPLAEAEGWLQERGGELSRDEREFIRLSSELRDREQAEKEASEKAQQILDKAYQKARRRIGIGSVILAVSLVGAVIAGVMAGNALNRQREAQVVTKLERQGVSALRQFESEQIEALLSAMGSGEELKALVKDGRPLEEYPTVSPMLALQKILDNIREKNQVAIKSKSYLTDISFSPDGKLLIFTQDEKGIGKLSNLEGQQLATFKSDGQGFSSVSFSPDGKLLVTGSSYRTVMVWNLNGKKLLEFKMGNDWPDLNAVKFSPDNKLIATASSNGSGIVAIWDLNGKRLTRLEANAYDVINFSPDSKRLAIGEDDSGDIKIWDIDKQKLLKIHAHKWRVKSVSFSPDSKILASAGLDGSAKLWNLQGQQLTELKRDFWSIGTVSFSPNSNLLATTGYNNGTINLWNIKGEHLNEFQNKNANGSVIFSPDGKQFATLGSDNTVSLWNLTGQKFPEFNIKDKVLAEAKNQLLAEAKRNGQLTLKADELNRYWNMLDARFDLLSSTQVIKFMPDGKHLAIITYDGASLWDLHGQQLAKFKEDKEYFSSIYSMIFSPDGKLVATLDDKTVKLWNLKGQQLAKFESKSEKDRVRSISFTPDSKLLATGGEDGTVKLLNLTGKELRSFKAHQQSVTSISFSPDGKLFATAGDDNTAKLWNLDGQLVATFKHQENINKVSFTSNGNLLATFGKEGTVKLWDLSGKQLVGFKISESEKIFDFSPDGKLIATVGGDGMAKLWTFSGQQVAEFRNNQGVATSISFSPDGKQVAISGRNGKVLLQPVRNLDQLLAQGCDWLKDYFVTHPDARKNLQVCQVGKE